jgi:hypothetical protein
MRRTRRSIELSPEERRGLETFTKTGKQSVKLVKRAAVILALDTSNGRKPDTEASIAHHTGVSRQTVQNAKRDFEAVADLPAFLQRKKRETPPIPPRQPENWKPVSSHKPPSKKTPLKPHLKDCWCISPEHNGMFAAAMEDVLAVYGRPYDEQYPVVCMDKSRTNCLRMCVSRCR